MAQLSTQRVSQSGLVPDMQPASAGGDSWQPSVSTFLIINNAGESSVALTVEVTAEAFGQPVQSVTVEIVGGAQMMLGTFPPAEVAGNTGQGTVTYSTSANLTVAAISI